MSFWGALEEDPQYICASVPELFLEETSPLFIQGFQVCELAQVWELRVFDSLA